MSSLLETLIGPALIDEGCECDGGLLDPSEAETISEVEVESKTGTSNPS